MTSLVTCDTYNTGIATKQDKLLNCAGTALPGGTRVPSCDEVDEKIAAAVNVDGVTITGAGTVTDKFKVPMATTTVAGLIEEATGEETRLGATDPNKADRAVTPESMSYALQTGKEYKINIVVLTGSDAAATFESRNTASANSVGVYGISTAGGTVASAGVTGYLYGGTTAGSPVITRHSGVNGQVLVTCTTPSGFYSEAVSGNHAGSGVGTKHGGAFVAQGTGGTNIGVFGQATNGTINWAGYFNGNVAAGPITTLSDATLKENVTAIDPAKALQFRNGLRWVSYEMFTEQQEQITETVVDAEGNETKVPTGRYEVKRNSLGQKYGLIAQEVQVLTKLVGAFGDVVAVVGEYFTLDEQGYPVKGADGEPVVNKRFGLDYDAINVIVMAAEQTDSSVSRRQAFRALHQFGLLETVEAAVAKADKITQIEWETAQSFNRNYGTVIELAKDLGLTDKQLDDLFALARTL